MRLRQQAWLWSRPWLPTEIVRLQGVDPGGTYPRQVTVGRLYWFHQSAAEFLHFRENALIVKCSAGQVVHEAFLNAYEDSNAYENFAARTSRTGDGKKEDKHGDG